MRIEAPRLVAQYMVGVPALLEDRTVENMVVEDKNGGPGSSSRTANWRPNRQRLQHVRVALNSFPDSHPSSCLLTLLCPFLFLFGTRRQNLARIVDFTMHSCSTYKLSRAFRRSFQMPGGSGMISMQMSQRYDKFCASYACG